MFPEDFGTFWAEVVEEANAASIDFRRSRTNEFDLPGFYVETLVFRGIDGQPRYGWIAYDPNVRRQPGFLWVPPYGRESKLPDSYGTRFGFTSMSFNLHGEGAFHQEKYDVGRGYFAAGAESPESWVFRRIIQDCILALRIFQLQPEVDEDRIGTMGMSQGGGLSVWLGAWCPIVKAVCADMPFLGNIGQTLSANVYRYPLKELVDYMETIPVGRERVLNTLSYFDTVHQALNCKVPTQVSLGLKDPACRPDTVRTVYEAVAGPKRLITYDWGHDWHPEMIENNRQWLLDNLR